MRKIITILVCFLMLTGLAACSAPANEPGKTPAQASATATPEPSPTVEPSPTPEPVPESVQLFSADARQYILDVLCDSQTAMRPLLSSEVFDAASPDFLNAFSYMNFNEEYNAETGQIANSDRAAQYELGLKLDDGVDWSDDFNYNVIAGELGVYLGLEYADGNIYFDGTEKITQKWAQGSEEGYSSSWIYLDSGYAAEGSALLTFVYPGQNEAFNALVSDSFGMISLPFAPILAPYGQTCSTGYSPDYNSDINLALGNVGISWWDVSSDDCQRLIGSLSSTPGATAVRENDSFYSYRLAVDNEYFSSVTVDIFSYYSENGAKVDCTIYYN
jgi:hypothetical protein